MIWLVMGIMACAFLSGWCAYAYFEHIQRQDVTWIFGVSFAFFALAAFFGRIILKGAPW